MIHKSDSSRYSYHKALRSLAEVLSYLDWRDTKALGINVLTLFLQAAGQKQPLVSALYVFGDSTIDPGNNNFPATIVKADFPPYGRDFPNGQPTGRFTNGRLITDQLSELAGLSILLGLLTFNHWNVLPLEKQVENFRLYKAQLVKQFGHEIADRTICQALFAISGGTDDFANNYFINPLTRKKYTIEQFQDLLLNSLSKFIQNVYNEGATNIGIVGLPPFGCLPLQISLHNIVENTCVEEFNDVASSFNSKIKALIEKIRPNFPGVLIAYLDIYDKLFEIIKSPTKYGKLSYSVALHPTQ
ncbi:hypothetical protein SUGI_0433370 [Cryptomeria japonica]|nr:hypothetical protein SUGI_0433370 [Cryptomeria japonica]